MEAEARVEGKVGPLVRSCSRLAWIMASFLSTSLSWFCEMISISLRRSSTLTRRISLRHWLRIFSRLTREYFSSCKM